MLGRMSLGRLVTALCVRRVGGRLRLGRYTWPPGMLIVVNGEY